MTGALLGGIIAGASSLLGGVGNSIISYKNNQDNLAFQSEANAKNEALMRESWAREDNAVQRRVADLEAAGLSKTLAAGSAASSSGPIQVKPLESKSLDISGIVPSVVRAIQDSQEYAKGDEELKLLENQNVQVETQNNILHNEFAMSAIRVQQSRIKKNMLEIAYDDYKKDHNWDRFIKRASQITSLAGDVLSLGNIFK